MRIAAVVAAVAAAALGPAPPAAVRRAETFVRRHAHTAIVRDSVVSRRSARDPRWARVEGLLADERLWAVWLRREAGRWVVRSGGVGRARARAHVPCDIARAFSPPAC